jgi:hypothetical protein
MSENVITIRNLLLMVMTLIVMTFYYRISLNVAANGLSAMVPRANHRQQSDRASKNQHQLLCDSLQFEIY